MTVNGDHTTYKNGDDWGMVLVCFSIVLPTLPGIGGESGMIYIDVASGSLYSKMAGTFT